MPDISILGSAVIREAQFDAAGGAVGGDYRIVARWLLSPVTAQGAASGGVLPRVIPNPAGGYDCDRFILRLFTGKGPNRRDFNPATGQFEAGDFPIACAPQLDAIIRPAAEQKEFSKGPDARTLLCATSSRAARLTDAGRLFHEGLAENIDLASVRPKATQALNIRDILADAEPAAARYMQSRALFLALCDAIGSFESGEGAAFVRAWVPRQEKAFDLLLGSERTEERAERLARTCLELSPDRLVEPMAILRRCKATRDEMTGYLASGLELNEGQSADLLDQVILVRALALADDTRRGSTAFLRYLKRLADERISAREALILSTSHGGRWFVYEPAAGAPEPLDRFERDSPLGQAFASDLAGLGYISPLIPAAVVAAWRGPIGMSITADALPAPSLMGSLGEDTEAFSPLPSDYCGRLFVEQDRRNYVDFDTGTAIPAAEMRELQQGGASTRPLSPPTHSQLFLDQVAGGFANSELSGGKEPEDEEDRRGEDEFHASTNDAMVRFWLRARHIPDPLGLRQLPGFNIYAQWRQQNASGTLPTLSELRPYLVNARTSFLTDIFHAFDLDKPAAPVALRVTALANWPVESPIVPRPEIMTNADTLSHELANRLEGLAEEILPTGDVYLALDKKWRAEGGGQAAWASFDLRQGLLLPTAADWGGYESRRDQLGFRWDPNAPVDPGKIGADGLRAATVKYRFFATTVDMFGQESEPVPVDCAEQFFKGTTAETLHPGEYRPRMRRTLPPPVGDGKGTGEESIPLSYNAANRCLEISFETPFRNQPGHDGMLQREPKRHLTAEIRVYRRFIRGEIDGLSPDPAPLKSLSADPDVIALDRWQEAQGFSFFRSQDLCPPAVGDLWQTVITTPGNPQQIEPDDHGYEYRAAIRFRVQDEWLGYYFPDEVRRAHHKVVGPQGADLVSSLGSEVVTRGTFGLSRRASCLDRALAVAPIAVPGGRFTPITQIGAAGIVSRDIVLSRLLSLQVDRETSQPWPDDTKWPEDAKWPGRKFRASSAQAKVMAAAMHRASLDFELKNRPFIDLLMREYARFDANLPATLAPKSGPELPARYGMIGLRGHVRLSWQAPTDLTAVRPAEFQIYLTRSAPAAQAYDARQNSGAAELIWTVRAEPDPAAIYDFIFPVPGGPAEKLIWSIVARSSAGNATPMMILHEQSVLSSLVPLAPTDIAVQAVPPGPADTMPTSAAQSLLPETIRLLGGNDRLRALASSPRLKLEWTGEREGGTYLALVKTRERWTQRDQPKRSAGEPFDAVLSRIARLGIGDKLDPADIAREELTDWLNGDLDVGLPSALADFFIPAKGRALAMDGLAATPQDRPWFVDYFHDLAAGETPGDAIMEYDHRYAYKLAAYRDIESNGSKVPRRLFSDFTDFSAPIRPVIPTWALSPLSAPSSHATGGALPTLRFSIGLDDIRPVLGFRTLLGFHVVIVRDIGGHQVPLGRPAILLTDRPGVQIVDAGEILRPGRNRAFGLDVSLQIGTFLIDDEGAREPLDQQIVSGLSLAIPAPASGREIAIEQPVTIKLGIA